MFADNTSSHFASIAWALSFFSWTLEKSLRSKITSLSPQNLKKTRIIQATCLHVTDLFSDWALLSGVLIWFLKVLWNSRLHEKCTRWWSIERYRCPGFFLQKIEDDRWRRSIDQKLRLRNFDARHGRTETGALVKNRKGMSGVEGGHGSCYQRKENASVRKETDAVSATKLRIVHKTQNTLPPHFLSQPHHEAKVTMGLLFDNRAYIAWKVFARPRLVNIGIHPSAIFFFEKMKRVVRLETSVCFPNYKAEEQPNKKPEKSYFPKKKRTRETTTVFCMRVMIVSNQNRHRMPPHLLSHPWHEVEVCRRKEVSKAEVIMVPFFDKRADTVWKVFARDRFVCSGIHVVNRTHSSFCAHALAWLKGWRCCSTCLWKNIQKERLSTCHHVITCLIVRCLSVLWPLPLLRVSLLFCPFSSSSSILVIILHVVGTSEYKNPSAPAEWGVWPCGFTKSSYTLTGRPCNRFRCSSCSLIGLSCCGIGLWSCWELLPSALSELKIGSYDGVDLATRIGCLLFYFTKLVAMITNLTAKACRSPLLVSFPSLPSSNVWVVLFSKFVHVLSKLFGPSDVRLRASIDFTHLKAMKAFVPFLVRPFQVLSCLLVCSLVLRSTLTSTSVPAFMLFIKWGIFMTSCLSLLNCCVASCGIRHVPKITTNSAFHPKFQANDDMKFFRDSKLSTFPWYWSNCFDPSLNSVNGCLLCNSALEASLFPCFTIALTRLSECVDSDDSSSDSTSSCGTPWILKSLLVLLSSRFQRVIPQDPRVEFGLNVHFDGFLVTFHLLYM